MPHASWTLRPWAFHTVEVSTAALRPQEELSLLEASRSQDLTHVTCPTRALERANGVA